MDPWNSGDAAYGRRRGFALAEQTCRARDLTPSAAFPDSPRDHCAYGLEICGWVPLDAAFRRTKNLEAMGTGRNVHRPTQSGIAPDTVRPQRLCIGNHPLPCKATVRHITKLYSNLRPTAELVSSSVATACVMRLCFCDSRILVMLCHCNTNLSTQLHAVLPSPSSIATWRPGATTRRNEFARPRSPSISAICMKRFATMTTAGSRSARLI